MLRWPLWGRDSNINILGCVLRSKCNKHKDSTKTLITESCTTQFSSLFGFNCIRFWEYVMVRKSIKLRK